MSVERQTDHVRTGFRFRDLVVIILCLSVGFLGINLFRLDLSRTINLQNVEPVGSITIKHNIVQRRIADRVLWDRLAVQSPVYLGDLIRIPSLSAATLDINGQQIDLNENTLIRIQLSPEGDTLRIELSEGSIDLITTADGGIQISLMGHVVDTAPGTTLSASAGEEGISVQVNEGAAVFVDEGGGREIKPGMMIAIDNYGTEKLLPAVVVMFPRPNARYVKSSNEFVVINFSWNPVNFLPEHNLRLEIAPDRNFSRSVQLFQNLDVNADIALDAGLWNWRLSGNINSVDETILASGRLTVVEASELDLTSPARGSMFSYYDETPSLRFQWTDIEEASHYIVEISSAPDFSNSVININSVAPFFIESNLGAGTWYWRVKPSFPSAYEGSAVFSRFSFFHIEQSITESVIAVTLPEPEPEPIPPVPLIVSLLSPARGESLPGLTALREQTVFTWEADGYVQRSRFVLSSNSNPLYGLPVLEIVNPGSAIRVNSLEEGTWYWTIEAESADGLVSIGEVRSLSVLPIPLLPAPVINQPVNRQRIDIEQLRTQNSITFSWSAVQGANGYVLTLSNSATGVQIIRMQLGNQTRWVLDNINLLSPGTFIWQLEAVNIRNNTIEQRGNVRENSFIIDVPSPSVRLENPGVLYGY